MIFTVKERNHYTLMKKFCPARTAPEAADTEEEIGVGNGLTLVGIKIDESDSGSDDDAIVMMLKL